MILFHTKRHYCILRKNSIYIMCRSYFVSYHCAIIFSMFTCVLSNYISQNIYFNGFRFWSLRVNNVWSCARTCVKMKMCKSFNYDFSNGTCDMNSDILENHNRSIFREIRRHSVYSSIQDWPLEIDPACHSRPCELNEVCVPGLLINGTCCSYGCMKIKLRCPKLKTKVTSSRIIGSTVTLPRPCPCGRSGEYSAICRDNLRWEEVSTCNYTEPLKDGWSQYENSCYYFGKTDANWADSQTYCEGLGGYLAEINNTNENSYLWDKVNNLQGNFWIGGTHKTTKNLWIWDSSKTQITSSWSAWAPGQPDYTNGIEDCLEFRFSYKAWNDAPCDVQQKYICEVELK